MSNVTLDTRVLTADLHWVSAAKITRGDLLLAFGEDSRPASQEGYKRRGRLFQESRVEAVRQVIAPCFDLEFDDGTKVRSPAQQRWLVGAAGGKRAHWVPTQNLVLRRTQASRVIKSLNTWRTGGSREAGYLAAAFDGEGNIVQRQLGGQVQGVTGTLVGFSQVDNAMLAEAERCLNQLGFNHGHHVEPRDHKGYQDVHRLIICRRPDFLRFLGEVRPVRLLAKFQPGKLGLLNVGTTVRLVGKTLAHSQEFTLLKTTTNTYFADGLTARCCDDA